MRRRPFASEAILLVTVLAAAASCRGLPLARFAKPIPTNAATADAQLQPDEQLKFVCDFSLPPDHRLIRELKAERDEIYNTLELPASEEEIVVHLFHNADTYHEQLARKFPMVPNRRAFFVETDTRLEVYAHWSDRVAEDLRHEVGHGYLHASVPAIPLWLDEGLAEYFEVPRSNGGLNRPHLLLLADLIEVNHWQPNLKKLEALSTAGEMEQVHYAEAWAWVYFFLNSTPERRELLTGYLRELREKGKAPPLSSRLASRHIEPQHTLNEFLVALKTQQTAN